MIRKEMAVSASRLGVALLLALGLSGAAQALNPDGHLKQCIPLSAIRAKTAESPTSLLLHGPGGRVWRNHLPERCDGLRSVNTLGKIRFKPAQPDRLCKGDTFQLSASGLLDVVTGDDPDITRCTLGGFEPTSEMSVTEELRR
jgi:hypothetical protein